MSGRKKTEVLNLLSISEGIRNEINGYMDSDIDYNISMISECYDSLESEMKKIKEMSNLIKDMEIDGIEEQKENVKKILQNCMNIVNDKKVIDEIKNKRNEFYITELNLVSEAKNIKRSIRGKSDYVDDEYNRGIKLIDRLNELKSKKMDLKYTSTKKSNLYKVNLEKVRGFKSNITKILDIINEINAKNIVESINNIYDKIDVDLANKFLKDEYENLKTKVNELNNKNINYINEESKNIQNLITSFTTRLEENITNYNNLKNEIQTNLNNIKEIEIKEFKNFSKILEKKGNDKYNLIEFYEKYTGSSFQKYYEEKMEEINSLLSKDNLEEALVFVKELNVKFNDIESIVIDTYEKLSINKLRAQKITKVMSEKKFKVNIEFMDGDVSKGYKITSKRGDEVVEFDVIEDENGSTVNLNHHESEKICGSTMKEIYKDLRDEAGIIDITKYGKSVIFNEKEKTTSKTSKKTDYDRIKANSN